MAMNPFILLAAAGGVAAFFINKNAKGRGESVIEEGQVSGPLGVASWRVRMTSSGYRGDFQLGTGGWLNIQSEFKTLESARVAARSAALAASGYAPGEN